MRRSQKVFPSPWKGEGEGGGRSVHGGHKHTRFHPDPTAPPSRVVQCGGRGCGAAAKSTFTPPGGGGGGRGVPRPEPKANLRAGAGTQFDPALVERLLQSLEPKAP